MFRFIHEYCYYLSMATNKTQQKAASPESFFKTLTPAQQAEAKALLKVFEEATKQPAVLWGSSLVGFGTYHYKYESGREGDFFRTGFSIRKTGISLYIGTMMEQTDLLAQIGPHKASKGCLMIKNLAKADLSVIKKIVQLAYKRKIEFEV